MIPARQHGWGGTVGSRQIAGYLAGQSRQIAAYLAGQFRQIASLLFKNHTYAYLFWKCLL